MIGASTFWTNSGASAGTTGGMSKLAGHLVQDLHLEQVGQGVVHGGKVLLHDLLAALAVGVLDGFS